MTVTDTAGELDVAPLRAAVTGRVLLPGEPGYAERATPWNVAVPSTPLAVVEAADATDVVAAVRFAATAGIRVGVQSTGHGAVVADRPTLLVHTGRLDELTIRPDGSARVGAGVRWQAVLDAAAGHGLTGLAGSAPGVGVVGYLTGGGMGPLARTYGVASDHVTAFDVATGDGELRRASTTENPALFWGLRGGKGTLGIVTAVEIALFPVTEVYGGCVFVAGPDIAATLHTWNRWSAGLPEQATTSVAVMRLPEMPGVPEPLAGQVTLAVRFAYVGDPAEGERLVAPVLEAAPVLLGGMGVMPAAAVGAIHADPVDPMPTLESALLLTGLPDEAVDTLLGLAGHLAECPQLIVEVRQLGGAIAREPEHSSAFAHRDAGYALLLIGLGVPPLLEALHGHAAAVTAAMAPWSDGHCLPNFEASSAPAVMARKYPSQVLARLASLAETYGPQHVIAGADPVRAAAANA
jgi:FAD/FMN-containing dehydrogenase